MLAQKYQYNIKKYIMLWLIFSPFLLLGVALLGLAMWKVILHWQTLSWQPVNAVVLERGIQTESQAPNTTLHYTVRYTYDWKGKHYENSDIALWNNTNRTMAFNKHWSKRLNSALGKQGQQIPIWVNPKAPNQSIVVRDIHWFELGICLLLGLVIFWTGILMVSGNISIGIGISAHTQFSWCHVSIMWGTASLLAMLIPLLWRDGHIIWTIIFTLPAGLALYGTWFGFTHSTIMRQ